jgi:hypothetical protein
MGEATVMWQSAALESRTDDLIYFFAAVCVICIVFAVAGAIADAWEVTERKWRDNGRK